MTGSLTVIKVQIFEFKNLPVLNPSINEARHIEIPFSSLKKRSVGSIFTECGYDRNLPISSQKHNPLPDRRALDDVVFDVLGLTSGEREAVYEAVIELVRARLEKARSV